MVTEKFLEVLFKVLTWLFAQLPGLELPGDLKGSVASLRQGLGAFPGLPITTWIGVQTIAGATAFVLVSFALSAVVKFFRVVASFLSGGGGSAA